MSRRRRALIMVVAAMLAGGLGMALVSGYSASVSQSFGRLRPVVVVTRFLPAGQRLTKKAAAASLEVRQVPVRFAPAGVLGRAEDAVGFQTAAPLAAGSYVTAGALRLTSEKDRRHRRPGPGPGRVPVELMVSGAAALPGAGVAVDVLVTREGRISGQGSTSVVAGRVPLIAVAGGDPDTADSGLTTVVLGLNRKQAITLIDAESFARRVTILRSGSR